MQTLQLLCLWLKASPLSRAGGPQAGGGIFFPFIGSILKWIHAIRDGTDLRKSNRDLALGRTLEATDPVSW